MLTATPSVWRDYPGRSSGQQHQEYFVFWEEPTAVGTHGNLWRWSVALDRPTKGKSGKKLLSQGGVGVNYHPRCAVTALVVAASVARLAVWGLVSEQDAL